MSRKLPQEEINKMAENRTNDSEEIKKEPEILVNDYGTTRDSTVVVEEETRTVLLTDKETIVIEKEPRIDIVPKNRPRKIYAGMWGKAETAIVALGMLAILAVVLLVVLVVLPAQKELEQNKAERRRLETELLSAQSKYGDITTTEGRVAQLIGSVTDFENRFLLSPTNGKTALYQRINGLISAYGLINTTGPDYAPLEIADDRRGGDQETESERGRAKFQSLFPGVYATMTVEGSYQNLRRFIRDIETGGEFVVISAVELEPADNQEKNNQATGSAPTQASINSVKINPQVQSPQNFPAPNNGGFPNPNAQFSNPNNFPQQQQFMQQQQGQPGTATTAAKVPRGRMHGETVSLRLEMAAYFRRANVLQTTVSSQ